MNKEERIKAEARHEAMKGLAESLMRVVEGKEKIQVAILLEADELSTKVMDFGGKYADPCCSGEHSEEELKEILEYLGLVETGIDQFIAGLKQRGEEK